MKKNVTPKKSSPFFLVVKNGDFHPMGSQSVKKTPKNQIQANFVVLILAFGP